MPNAEPLSQEYDAVVVGARCAGAATAMLLARRGLKVLAIDRQDYGSDTLSTHALMRAGVLQLARWGVLDAIVEAGTPAVRRTSFHYGEEAVAVDIKPHHGVGALYAPRRTVIDRVLVDAAQRAGADVRHGLVLLSLEFGTDRRGTGATIRDRDGSARSIRTPLVIGADGRHSTVARLVRAQHTRTGTHRAAAIYAHVHSLADRGYRWLYRPGVSAGVIPTNDGNSCVFVSLPPGRFRREMADGARALFDRVLNETDPALAAEVARTALVGKLRGFPGEAGFLRQAYGPGWALVGDAGYFKDPMTAHGITDALRDAELLAGAVANGSRDAFSRYQGQRDALSSALFQVTEEIASFDWTLDELKDKHLRLNKAMKAETEALAAHGPALPIAA